MVIGFPRDKEVGIMRCYFDSRVAKETGSVKSAILFEYIRAVTKSAQEREDAEYYRNGAYWFCRSFQGFVDYYSNDFGFSKSIIRTALQHLKEHGLIAIEHFDALQNHNMAWYTITPKGLALVGENREEKPRDPAKANEKKNAAIDILKDIPNQEGAKEVFDAMTSPEIGMEALAAAKIIQVVGDLSILKVCIDRVLVLIEQRKTSAKPICHTDKYLAQTIKKEVEKHQNAAEVSQSIDSASEKMEGGRSSESGDDSGEYASYNPYDDQDIH